MTKMAAMPIHGKNYLKISQTNPADGFVQKIFLGWPWHSWQQSQICSLMLLYGKVIIVLKSYELKVGTYNRLSKWVPEVKVIVWPLSKVTQNFAFNFLLL